MPVWYQQLKELRDAGDVKIVGLIQEQHPDRCALFLQWKQMDFPVLVDSLNRTGVSAVPLLWAIDENGVVRKTRPDAKWFRDTFVKTDYPEPDSDKSRLQAESKEAAGVELFLAKKWTAAIDAWQVELDDATAQSESDRAAAWFRWACACRARYDYAGGDTADFQKAVKGWSQAIRLAP